MSTRKKIFALVGSASSGSSNEKLVATIAALTADVFEFTVFTDLKSLPHFDPELSTGNPPASIVALRNAIAAADGILISTPEYVFSIPSGLKNVIEWCVATTLFTDKPVGLITAAAHGQKGHEELELIMKTVMAKLSDDTSLLVQGIKGKINKDGIITDGSTEMRLQKFAASFKQLVLS